MIEGIKPDTAGWKKTMCERMEDWLLPDIANFVTQHDDGGWVVAVSLCAPSSAPGDMSDDEFTIWMSCMTRHNGLLTYNARFQDGIFYSKDE